MSHLSVSQSLAPRGNLRTNIENSPNRNIKSSIPHTNQTIEKIISKYLLNLPPICLYLCNVLAYSRLLIDLIAVEKELKF